MNHAPHGQPFVGTKNTTEIPKPHVIVLTYADHGIAKVLGPFPSNIAAEEWAQQNLGSGAWDVEELVSIPS